MTGETWLVASLIVLGICCVLAAASIFHSAFGNHDGIPPRPPARTVSIEDLIVARHWGFTEAGWLNLTTAQRARYRSDMLTQQGWKA